MTITDTQANHKIMSTSSAWGYSAPVNISESNPAAHGNIGVTEFCACGAQRSRLINGRHEEVGAWDLPHDLPNVQACAARASHCRAYLVALARSKIGRDALTAAGLVEIIDSPERGDDDSTITAARMVEPYFRRALYARGLL